ncbi:MAG: DUF4342 domain-containing protein [Clostridiales bacterium]|nr:DUF4342 domain-containing protein [Clostridiales bacterium]MDO4350752.1 DUF4342 domain-containing protein [Eubacteriales bacterium]MDY4009326.1 DUF4342 domain-containing protein [Candidatus Limiplasma sp.]
MTEEELKQEAEKTVEQIKELVKKGNIARVMLKKDGETIINLPLNVGIVSAVIGLAASPWAMLTAALATIGTDCQVELHTTEGEILDISGKAVGRMAADIGSAICQDIKDACSNEKKDLEE